MAPTPIAVIFDLDGVIRDWNDDDMAAVETAHGLDPGTILAVGFSEDLGGACMTGRLSYREWMDEIRRRILARHGHTATDALDAWEANVGLVDTAMLEVLRAVRRQCTVAVLSNGTTRLRSDLDALELTREFDVIFNSAEIGIAKPDPEVFHHVLRELGVQAADTVFIDDLVTNVGGARSVGIDAHLHEDLERTVAYLRRLGIDVPG